MTWHHFRRETPEGSQLVGVTDEALAAIETRPAAAAGGLSSMVWSCVVRREGPALPELTHDVEVRVDRAVTAAGGHLVATVRSARSLSMFARFADGRAAERVAGEMRPIDEVDVAVVHDPDFTRLADLRPVEMEQQSMRDLQVLDELAREGDTGGSRTIEHVIADAPPGRRDELVRSLRAVGYAVEDAAGDPAADLAVRHDGEPGEITPDAWTIRLIAERCDARYLGWRCPVLRPPSGRRRRGLRRR